MSESPPDRLLAIASTSPLLQAAWEELCDKGITNATADALTHSGVSDTMLDEFLSLAVRELRGGKLYGLAISIIDYIDQRGVGHDALDYVLKSDHLDDTDIRLVGAHMKNVKDKAAIRWCHSRLTRQIKTDTFYHSFLERHIGMIADELFDDMAAYLLTPNRGPGRYNFHSFYVVISHLEESQPFQQRVIDWINDGYLDGKDIAGSLPANVLYKYLNLSWGDPKFSRIVDALHTHVHFLLKSEIAEEMRLGMYHLEAMVDAKYRGADRVLEETVERVYDIPASDHARFEALYKALQAVVAHNLQPDDDELAKLVDERYLAIPTQE